MKNYIFCLTDMRYCYCFASTAKAKTPQTPLTEVVANALAVSSFLGKFPLNIGTSVGFVF